MRLIATYTDHQKGYVLSNYLKQEGIENLFEVNTNTDWGSQDYGSTLCRIWVYEEEQLEKSLSIVEEFEANPKDPKFAKFDTRPHFLIEPIYTAAKTAEQSQRIVPGRKTQETPLGIVTLYILVICSLIFIVAAMTGPAYVEPPKGLPLTPLYSSHIYKSMYFDYPKAYEIVDQLATKVGIEKLSDMKQLNAAGQALYQEYLKTPYWQGFYGKFVNLLKGHKESLQINAPLFEKIQEGEVWRLFTPCLLHSDIFHIFFNMIWLIILGRQMEVRLGFLRYVLFILLTGIVTNTAQYLMSGANFIGFSGILCAMLSFIWIRKRKAAWEGYQLQGSTFSFMFVFLFTIAGLQFISFLMEIYDNKPFNMAIANTAHLTGLVIGALLGSINFFAWKGSFK